MNLKSVKTFFKDNGPRISIGTAGVGYIATAFLTVRATKKAVKKIDKLEAALPAGTELTLFDRFKAVWTYYIPAVSSAAGATLLLVSGIVGYEKQLGAAATSLAISENALKELQSALRETLDEDKVKEVYDQVAEKKLETAMSKQSEDILSADAMDGLDWFLEPIGNHLFRSTSSKIKDEISDLNMYITNSAFGEFVSVEDYCDALGVKAPNLQRRLGWNSNNRLSIWIDSKMYNGIPVGIIVHRNPPDYDK